MAEENDYDYDALQRRLTDPDRPLGTPKSVLSGEDATEYGRNFLLREYGSEAAIVGAMRPGRPKVGAGKKGSSPVVRGVISQDDFEAFKQLERTTGMRQSELVRKAIHNLLVAEKLVS